MGHLIAQTILIPNINDVFSEIFSYVGTEFYEIPFLPESDAIKTYNALIPIEENGRTFALAENEKCLRSRRKTPSGDPQKFVLKKPLSDEKRRVAVFGKSAKRPYIEESIRLFSLDCGEKTEIRFYDEAEPKAVLEAIEKMTDLSTIMILSDDALPPERLDSNVLFTLLLIKDITKEKDISVIVEILDQQHQEISRKYDAKNIIVSTTYVSHIITQISENRNLYPLFNDLLTYDAGNVSSYEIYTYDAKKTFDAPPADSIQEQG